MSDYLDRYGRAQSLCHRLPPRWKLFLSFSVIGVGVSVPVAWWPLQGVLGALVFAGHSFARIPLGYLARRFSVFLPMVFLLSISVPAAEGFATAAGWKLMAAILCRSTLAFLTMLWLVNVMPFDQLLVTLRKLYVPEVLIAILAFMYRYIYVLWDEMERMWLARRARTFGSAGFVFRWRSSAQLIGLLLIRAMDRAERVHGAMCARGWDGRVRTLK